MTTSTISPPVTGNVADAASRLRLVLTVNAGTSFVAGLVGLLASRWVVDELGLQSIAWTRIVSAGLVVFAVDVLVGVRSARYLANTALLTSVLDLAWVAATVVVIDVVELTTLGLVAAAVMGLGVLDFALLQLWLRQRLVR